MSFDDKIAEQVKRIPRSGIRDFFELVLGRDDVISLGVGEPDFASPWHIREAAIYSLEKGETSYTSNLGLEKLRKSISLYVREQFEVDYDPLKEVLVTVGVSEALDLACRALLNPGDEVVYHEPCYVSYAPSVTLAHGEAISVGTVTEQSFSLDPEAFEKAWQPGCKILLLNFPTNPTGGTADRIKLERLARFAVEKDLIVISDEIYAELTYEGEHVSIASLPGMKERTILLHGFSKGFAMTGFRVGFACGPDWLIEAMMKIHQYCMMCAPILSQEAAVEALKNGADEVVRMKEQYQKRRDFIVRRFNAMGLECHLPRGSFYAFPSVKSTGLDEVDFCHRLLREQEVAVVPGTAFGFHGKNHFRASFSTSYEKLVEATDRIENFVESVNLEEKKQSAAV